MLRATSRAAQVQGESDGAFGLKRMQCRAQVGESARLQLDETAVAQLEHKRGQRSG